MKRVLICNDGVDSPNKGDQAILQAMKKQFAAHNGELTLSFIPYSGSRSIKSLFRLIKEIRRTDLFILGGGHPFQDLSSLAFLFFGLSCILCARIFGKRIVCYGIGAGPFTRPISRILAPRVLNLADAICVREQTSLNMLAALGVEKSKLHLSADAAFSLPEASTELGQELLQGEGICCTERPLILFCPRRWFCLSSSLLPQGKQKPQSLSTKSKALADELVLFLDSLIDTHGVQIVFVPMRKAQKSGQYGQDDDLFSAEIQSRMINNNSTHLLAGDYSPEQLKHIYSAADCVIGIRMHSIVLASSSCVPVMGIAITPAKGEGLFTLLGQPEAQLSIEESSAKKLSKTFEAIWNNRSHVREELLAKQKELRALANRNLDITLEHL